MKITHTYLTEHTETIDLDTNEGREYFARIVVQDEDIADEYIARLASGESITVNEDEPRYEATYEAVKEVM